MGLLAFRRRPPARILSEPSQPRSVEPLHPRPEARATGSATGLGPNANGRLGGLPCARHHPHSGHRESPSPRKGLFAGQATFGRCVSKTEWVYGFKVALSVNPEGVICAFGLAEAASDDRPIGDFLII